MLRQYTLTTFLVLSISCSWAQISGSYIYSAGVDSGTRTLTFSDSNFKDNETGHLNNKHGEGSFTMNNNQLYLNYLSLKDKDSSVYKIDTRMNPLNLTKIYVGVFDKKDAVIGARVAMRDKDFNLLFSINTLVNGIADFTITKVNNIRYLTVDYIGFNSVTIPYKKLENKSNDIFIDFKAQTTFVDPPHTDVYRVLKYDLKTLTLVNQMGIELRFHKMNN